MVVGAPEIENDGGHFRGDESPSLKGIGVRVAAREARSNIIENRGGGLTGR